MAARDSTALAERSARRFGLNLRRLLLPFVAAVVLGCWIATPLQRALHSRSVLTRIQSLGGVLAYDDEFDPGELSHSEKVVALVLGDHAFAPVDTIVLNPSRRLSDADLAVLAELRDAGSAFLCGPNITDTEAGAVSQLPALRQLGLVSTSITGDGLARLGAAKELENLMFSKSVITDEMLAGIGSLSTLREVGFIATEFTSNAWEPLARLPSLRAVAVLDSTIDGGLPKLEWIHRTGFDLIRLHNVSLSDDGQSRRLNLDYRDGSFRSIDMDGQELSAQSLGIASLRVNTPE